MKNLIIIIILIVVVALSSCSSSKRVSVRTQHSLESCYTK